MLRVCPGRRGQVRAPCEGAWVQGAGEAGPEAGRGGRYEMAMHLREPGPDERGQLGSGPPQGERDTAEPAGLLKPSSGFAKLVLTERLIS